MISGCIGLDLELDDSSSVARQMPQVTTCVVTAAAVLRHFPTTNTNNYATLRTRVNHTIRGCRSTAVSYEKREHDCSTALVDGGGGVARNLPQEGEWDGCAMRDRDAQEVMVVVRGCAENYDLQNPSSKLTNVTCSVFFLVAKNEPNTDEHRHFYVLYDCGKRMTHRRTRLLPWRFGL